MSATPGAEESAAGEFSSLDDAVHQRTRLAILTILHEAGEADFRFLRTTLDLTDGNLGRHLEVLLGAGYITTRRGYDGRRRRTGLLSPLRAPPPSVSRSRRCERSSRESIATVSNADQPRDEERSDMTTPRTRTTNTSTGGSAPRSYLHSVLLGALGMIVVPVLIVLATTSWSSPGPEEHVRMALGSVVAACVSVVGAWWLAFDRRGSETSGRTWFWGIACLFTLAAVSNITAVADRLESLIAS